jgi:hypothetical protein
MSECTELMARLIRNSDPDRLQRRLGAPRVAAGCLVDDYCRARVERAFNGEFGGFVAL